MKKLILPSLLLGALIGSASAQTLTKANNATTLNLAGSWVENTSPTSSNTLLFNSTWGTPGTVATGASLDVNGIQITDISGSSGRISRTSTNTITIGSGGINMSTASNNFRIDPGIILSANQTWSVASSRILNLTANGISGNFTAQVTGSGTLAFDAAGTATYGSQLEIDVTTLRINSDTDVTFTNANNSFTALTLFRGTARFSSITNAGADSAAGAFTTASMGGNATNGIFIYTGNTVSTNRSFQVDRRSLSSGILVSTAGETLTISGDISHIGSVAAVADNAFRVGGEGNLVLNGVVSNNTTAGFNTGLLKEGAGTLTLGNNNTFLGGVVVNEGTVTISANERIANTNKLTLNGGNFNVSTFTETMGILGVGSSNGTLTLGLGGLMVFANSSAEAWTGSLSIAGDFVSGSSIRFGTTNGGLLGSQLSAISIAGFEGIGLDDSGFLTATVIPEPSTWALFALGGTALVVLRRRRARF